MTMNVTLNNGIQMPALGFGVFQTPPDVTTQAEPDRPRTALPLACNRLSLHAETPARPSADHSRLG
jgi:hypothetical protein